MAGKIIIDAERCKGCGLCIVACPNKTIVIAEISNKNGYFPAQTDNCGCTGCAACAIICPEGIIEVHRDGSDKVTITVEPGNEDQARLNEGKA